LFALVVWFAVIAQYVLMLNNAAAPPTETTIRFFTFFTILTNTLVAVYFTVRSFSNAMMEKPGILTAVTVYITIVGLVYQVLLRQLWQPTGLQKIVDELLHSVNPILVIVYWMLYEKKRAVQYRQILTWLIYPLIYFVVIFIRGVVSGWYPYPFIDVASIGIGQTLLNAVMLLVFFALVAAVYIFTGKKLSR